MSIVKEKAQIKLKESCYSQSFLLIGQISQLVFKVRDRELQELGITSVQSAALYQLLLIGKNATIGSLADRLVIESHTASGLVKRMEKQGLIKVSAPKGQRNRKFISVTAKGKRLATLASQKNSLEELISVIPVKRCDDMVQLLKQIKEMVIKHLASENKPQYP